MAKQKIPFDKIEFKRQFRKYRPHTKAPICNGLDVETEKGYARVIADQESYTETQDIKGVLDFLLADKLRGKLNFFFNLEHDFETMFKWSRPILESIAKTTAAEYEGIEIKYIPEKSLSIRKRNSKGKWNAANRFFDVSQFYFTTLDDAAVKYLNYELVPKFEKMKEDRAILFQKYAVEEIGQYCIDDAYKTKLLGDRLVETYAKLGVIIKQAYSPAFVTQEFALRRAELPQNKLPRFIQKFYREAFVGGWVELNKRGVMRATSYDISSAYPAIMRELPDIERGFWKAGLDESAMGIVRCKITGGLSACSPIAYRIKDHNFYPYYDKPREVYLTMREYFAFREFYDIKIIESHYFREYASCGRPYAEIIDSLYDKKEKSKDELARMLSKNALTSMWGKTAELKPAKNGNFYWGKLYNPCYAAETTAQNRIRLFKAIEPHKEKVAMLITDGVYFDAPVSLPTSNRLGGFTRKEFNEECLIINPAAYQFRNKEKSGGIFFKNSDLWAACDTKSEYIPVSHTRPLHYRECIIRGQFDKIGMFVRVEADLSINLDIKRFWKPLKQARQLLEGTVESRVVPVSLLRG